MPKNNHLLLAVAGSGKTQRVVDDYLNDMSAGRPLVVTYLTRNQREVTERIQCVIGGDYSPNVIGWHSFLYRHFVDPFLPLLFPGQECKGIDFKSEPRQGVDTMNPRRYFNKNGDVLQAHLSRLAHLVHEESHGDPIYRLESTYSAIYIDECQDLCGWDLEILELLMDSKIPL